MGTDHVSDITDNKLFSAPFLPDHIRQHFNLFFAVTVTDEDLPVVLPDPMDLQFMEKRADGALAADHFFPRDQMSCAVHIHDRFHTQR